MWSEAFTSILGHNIQRSIRSARPFSTGWHGIHVEPVPHFADLLRRERPGDQVIEAAVSNCVGLTKLLVFSDTGLSD